MRILFIITYCFLFLTACEEKFEETKPSFVKMTESVYASVTILPVDLYQVYSVVPGILEKVDIKEGDQVKIGQTIAKISSSNQKIQIEKAALNVNYARENYEGKATALKSITDEINLLKDQIQLDSTNFFRQKSLWKKGIGSKNQLETKQLKYESNQSKLKILFKKYDQTKFELENYFKNTQNDLKRVKSNLQDFYIKSKVDGTVYTLLKNEGELISQQQPLAQIGKSNSFVIEMMIDEVDVAKIELDQKALISLDAYEGQVFEAKVNKIYPLKDNRTQTFKVEAAFEQAPPKLFAGLSGEANIVLSEKENVLTIPVNYVLENGNVNTKDGEISIKTGMKNMEWIEVVAGIDTATVLLKPEI